MRTRFGRTGVLFSLLFVMNVSLSGQAARQYTTADYQRAESFMPYNVRPLLLHGVYDPHWLADGRAWYADRGSDGTTFLVIDPRTGSKQEAFDQQKLAAALNSFDLENQKPGAPAPKQVTAAKISINDFVLSRNDQVVTLLEKDRQLVCDLSSREGLCKRYDGIPLPANQLKPISKDEAVSPDGRNAVFIRDWNLFLRDRSTGKETQLTTDGVPNFGYATDNAGWRHSESPVVVWSPDSRRIARYKQDQRDVGELYLNLVNTPNQAAAGKATSQAIDASGQKLVMLVGHDNQLAALLSGSGRPLARMTLAIDDDVSIHIHKPIGRSGVCVQPALARYIDPYRTGCNI